MSLELTLKPTSILGIKRLADRIQQDSSVKRSVALGRASKAAGFDNFAHARHLLAGKPATGRSAEHMVYVTAYWNHLDSGQAGRETLQVKLTQELDQLLERHDFANNRHLLQFRKKSGDHIECRLVFQDLHSAQKGVCAVARVLQFVDTTGLRPYSRFLVAPVKRWHADRFPGMDHESTWQDPSTKSLFYTDEPYSGAVAGKLRVRLDWAARNGFELVESRWPGMYAPNAGAVLFLLAKDPQLIRRVADAADAMPAGPEEESWTGQSAPYRPIFRSPKEQARQLSPRAPRDPRLARATAGSIPFSLFLSGNSRRPAGRMPLDVHDQVARELRYSIGAAMHRSGVSSRLNRVRNELDDWVQVEYDRKELDMERFSNMYYGSEAAHLKRVPTAAEVNSLVVSIKQVRDRLTAHYPMCPPLRKLLRQLDLAHKSALTWKTRESPHLK